MKSIKFLVYLCFILMCTACAPSKIEESATAKTVTRDNVKVGFSQMDNNGPWRIAETNSIMAEAAARGIELIYKDAKGSVEQQLDDVEYLLAQDIDYLVLAPKKYRELRTALIWAKEKGVKVILVDRAAEGIAGEDYLSLIISDNVWEAQQAGKLLADVTDGMANIIELTGTTGSSSEAERALGFRQIINQYPKMKIIASENADFSRAEGKSVMEMLIRDHKEEMTVVYAQNDEMAIGAIMALKAAGLEPGVDVVIVSIDGERDALKAVIAGDLYATIECNPYFGPQIFDVIEQHISGEEVNRLYINKDRIFTIENALEHVDKGF